MNTKIIVGMLLIATMCCGCIGSHTVSYSCTVDDGMLFLDDGTYHLVTTTGDGFFGTYSMNDGVLFLDRIVLGSSESIVFKMNNTELIDRDGDRWVKE